MKFSIDGVFKNIKFYFVIMTTLLALISFIELNRQTSFEKIQQLEEQKVLVTKIYQLGRNDLDYSLINTQGIGAQLKTNLSFLTSMTTNDFFGNILGLNDQYKNKIEKNYLVHR